MSSVTIIKGRGVVERDCTTISYVLLFDVLIPYPIHNIGNLLQPLQNENLPFFFLLPQFFQIQSNYTVGSLFINFLHLPPQLFFQIQSNIVWFVYLFAVYINMVLILISSSNFWQTTSLTINMNYT